MLLLPLQHDKTSQARIELGSRCTEVSLGGLHFGFLLFVCGCEMLRGPFLTDGRPLALNGFFQSLNIWLSELGCGAGSAALRAWKVHHPKSHQQHRLPEHRFSPQVDATRQLRAK
jgi:hypothetical protein